MREQELLIVRLHDEIVRATLEPAQDVLRIGQRREQNDRQPESRVVLDPLAQLVAVHPRHVDVGDHERRQMLRERGERLLAIARGVMTT